jgi:hypothetical protein
MQRTLAVLWLCLFCCGCEELPDIAHKPQFHNPFPQLSRIAVLPFFNQSNEPTLNGLAIANSYRIELQQIPGFEVMPILVVEQKLRAHKIEMNEITDFQQLARTLNVDVVVVGSVTDFSEYYPPRMGIAVNWYAANPCFHPIPPGYGLPWSRAEEEFIPDSLVREAEFSILREQLRIVTPTIPELESVPQPKPKNPLRPGIQNSPQTLPMEELRDTRPIPPPGTTGRSGRSAHFVVPATPHKPPCSPQTRPVIEHARQYDGHDDEFVAQLKNYYHFRDDERFGGWQAYLQRKDDFIRFCCHLHITEMLTARGGGGETRVVWRWPNDRYDQ